MNDYRERLQLRGLLKAFMKARQAQDGATMRRILTAAEFSEMEIESVMWSKGSNVEGPPVESDKWTRIREAVVNRLATAVVSGVILGGAFVYFFGISGAPGGKPSHDYRSPKDAYYLPFLWGFGLGAISALVTGVIAYDPTAKDD